MTAGYDRLGARSGILLYTYTYAGVLACYNVMLPSRPRTVAPPMALPDMPSVRSNKASNRRENTADRTGSKPTSF